MVSTEARAKMAPRIHRRYGLVFILDTDINDSGFPAPPFYKFLKSDFSGGSANHQYRWGDGQSAGSRLG